MNSEKCYPQGIEVLPSRKIKMARVRIEAGGPRLMMEPSELPCLIDYWEEGGDSLIVDFVEMTEEEIAALPEFDGF